MTRKLEQYRTQVVPALMQAFGKTNTLAVAKLEKIVVNVGIGRESTQRDKTVAVVVDQLSKITGQKASPRPARLSNANFKIRQGEVVGVAVTLRGDRMWSFFDKVVSVVLPQVKDFQGVSRTAFDKQGNYSLGLREQIIFPELSYDDIDQIRGMQCVFTIRNSSGATESLQLLEMLGMPFTKERNA